MGYIVGYALAGAFLLGVLVGFGVGKKGGMNMSNRPGICWKCVHREDCKMFNKNPEAKVTECGRFLMKDGDRAIMQALYDEFFMTESEVEE